MNWTVTIAPKGDPSKALKYTVTADKNYYAKIEALIQYRLDVGSSKRPRELMDDVDMQVRCHTDGRLADYSKVR